MDKDKQILALQEFYDIVKSWREIRNSKGTSNPEATSLKEQLVQRWGLVEEIFKQLGINYHGILERQRIEKIKPREGDLFVEGFAAIGNNIDEAFNIIKIQTLVASAKTKLESSLPVIINALPSVHQVINILSRFSDVVSRLKHRRKGKTVLEVSDEYDVQDILYVMLKGAFPTLQYEEPNKKVGVVSSVADFTIEDLGLYVEAKFISKKGKEKEVQEQCKQDLVSYSKQSNCQKIIFFVYDPNRCVDNEQAYKTGISDKFSVNGKEVEVIALITR